MPVTAPTTTFVGLAQGATAVLSFRDLYLLYQDLLLRTLPQGKDCTH